MQSHPWRLRVLIVAAILLAIVGGYVVVFPAVATAVGTRTCMALVVTSPKDPGTCTQWRNDGSNAAHAATTQGQSSCNPNYYDIILYRDSYYGGPSICFSGAPAGYDLWHYCMTWYWWGSCKYLWGNQASSYIAYMPVGVMYTTSNWSGTSYFYGCFDYSPQIWTYPGAMVPNDALQSLTIGYDC
jgi:hypothetical protein